MTDQKEPPAWPRIMPVDSPEFDQRQRDTALDRANRIIDWALANPKGLNPMRSEAFRREFPDITTEDVKLALAEVARIAAS